MPNVIPSSRVPFLEAGTAFVAREWFRFLQSLQPALVGTVQAVLDFPNTLAGTGSDLTVTVPGAVDGDVVLLGVPAACMLSDSCYTGWVSAPNTVTVRLDNYSAAPKDPPSGKFRVVVTRYS